MVKDRVTRAQAVAAIRRKWPKAELRENKRAPSKDEREAARVARQAGVSRIKEIEAILATETTGHHGRLLKAARFVVDVNGDEPSISELRTALEQSERVEALLVERRDIRKNNEEQNCWSYRWDVCVVRGIFTEVVKSADTLDELMESIK